MNRLSPIRTLIAVAFVAAVTIIAPSMAAAQTYTWAGGPEGYWIVQFNWSPFGIPNSATADVSLDDGIPQLVHLDDEITIRTLTLDTGDELKFEEDGDLTVTGDELFNDGTILQTNVDPEGGNNIVTVMSPELTLTGNGLWVMDEHLDRRIVAEARGNVLINDMDHEIAGAGRIGASSGLGIINRGNIFAGHGVGNQLTIAPGSDADAFGIYDLVNEGEMMPLYLVAILQLSAGQYLNRGVIGNDADTSARTRITQVRLDNEAGGILYNVDLRNEAEVRGGEMAGIHNVVTAPSAHATIGSIAMPEQLLATGLTRLEGTLTFDENDVALLHGETLIASSGVTLDGLGEAHLGGGGTVSNEGPIVAGVLTVEEGMLLSGNDANLGGNSRLGIQNLGTIESNQIGDANPLVVEPGVDANVSLVTDFINEGVLRATDVDVVLRNQQFVNIGRVEAEPGARVYFESSAEVLNVSGSRLVSGTWRPTGTNSVEGRVEIDGGPITEIESAAVLELAGPLGRFVAGGQEIQETLTSNAGTLRILDGRSFIPQNAIENGGRLEIASDGSVFSFFGTAHYTQTFEGTLALELEGTAQHGYLYTVGEAWLGGTLEVRWPVGYLPESGDSFKILQADGGVLGTFDTLDLPTLGIDWDVQYNPTDVTIVALTVVDVEESETPSPIVTARLQASPNPFRAATTIRYGVPTPGDVVVDLFDVSGRRAKTLVQSRHAAGSYSVGLDGHRLAAGTYLVRVRVGTRVTASEKVVLVR